MQAAYSLGQIDPGNETAIASLIQFIQTFQDARDDDDYCNIYATRWLSYEFCLLNIADNLVRILPSDRLPQVVTALKDYLGEPFYKNSSYRYEAVYSIIWHCAQNMTYPDFYKAWHS